MAAGPPPWKPPPGGFVSPPGTPVNPPGASPGYGAPLAGGNPLGTPNAPPVGYGPPIYGDASQSASGYVPPPYDTAAYGPPRYSGYVNTQQAVSLAVLALLLCGNVFAIGGIITAVMAGKAQDSGDSDRARLLVNLSYGFSGGGIVLTGLLFGVFRLLLSF